MQIEKKKWRWQLGCNDASISELVTKFPSEVKTRSIQEPEENVGLWMVCVRRRIKPSIHSKLILYMTYCLDQPKFASGIKGTLM